MRLTRASDYAVRVLIHLARNAGSVRATREDIIAHTGVPAAFLNKIIQRLVRAGLVGARPGVKGGCWLAVAPEGITALQVIEAMDGAIGLSECLGDSPVCSRSGSCKFRSLLCHLQREIVRILSATTVADLARDGGDGMARIPVVRNP